MKGYLIPVNFKFEGAVRIEANSKQQASEIAKSLSLILGKVCSDIDEDERIIDWDVPYHSEHAEVVKSNPIYELTDI